MNDVLSVREQMDPILSEVAREPLPRQVIALASSESVPSAFISEQLAASLCAETRESVVLVRLEPLPSEARQQAPPELSLNGEFHMPAELRRTEAGFHFITLLIQNDPPTPAGIESLVSRLSRHFRHVLIETRASGNPTPWLLELLRRSHLAFLFVKPTAEEVRGLESMMREARTECHGGFHLKPVACLAPGESVAGVDLLAQRVGVPFHAYVRGCPSLRESGIQFTAPPLYRADVRRLAREIGGCLVGIALSSGAAKGFAHVGVLQVFEEHGLEVDVVAGASMGAYVGSLWAHGCDGAELERLSRELEGRWTLLKLLDPAIPPRRGFVRGFAVKKRLMRSLGHERFADMVRPLRVVAANLATLERIVFSAGEVATAVHASVAVPGICVPPTIDGDTYTDGGIVDPLPVDVLREMGVGKIIAVNVIPTPDRIRFGIQAELELERLAPKRGWFRTAPRERQMNYFARGNMLEVLMRSVHGAQIRMAEASCLQADLVVRPDIYDDCWLDYRNPGRFIALGREAATRQLDEIKSLVNRKETVREPQRASEPLAAAV